MNTAHVPLIALRKLHAGELVPDDAAGLQRHLQSCAACRAKLASLQDEQRKFEEAVPFEAFAAGVARAAHEVRPPVRQSMSRFAAGMASAAAIVLAIIALPTLKQQLDGGAASGNRTKGGAEIELRVAGSAGQRVASDRAPEPLAQGERVRIGYLPGSHRYVLAVSVDAGGEVTPLYPESGKSLEVEPDASGMRYLPGSLEFTGRGEEDVVVVLSDAPIRVDEAKAKVRAAFDAAGKDVRKLGAIELPGEQFHRRLQKP